MNLISDGKPKGLTPNSSTGLTELKSKTSNGNIIVKAIKNKIEWFI